MQYLKSLLYIGFMVGSVILFATFLILLGWTSLNVRHAIARSWCHLQLRVLKHFLGLDYVIEGRENIPDEPCVAYWKHTSSWETFLTLDMWKHQCWVLKRELTWIPIFGWALMLIEPIAIDRSGGRSAVSQVIEKGRKKLAEGCWINIFPEGTRVPPGETKRYGRSGALLAAEAGVPVLPIAHNAGDLWPRHSVLKKPGKITVRIGEPIFAKGRSAEEVNQEAKEWIEGQMREISSVYARAYGN